MAHKHSVYNTDEHFLIDGVTRAITQQSGKTRLMQYDHNSERYEFEMPRYIDSHDMSLCNRVQIHFINVGSGGSSSSDVYKVTDLIASPADDKVIIFSWLVSQNATMYAGSLNFLIQFACVQDDGTVDYLWHTDICKGISVSSGFNNSENIIEQYSDILMQWEQQLFGAGDSVKQQIGAKSQEELAAIEAKGEAVLLSIPEEYSETATKVDETVRTKADAIVQTVDGTAITVSDSSDDFLRGFRVFGKSTQDGTPTPDAPIDIDTIGDSGTIGVNITEQNLLPFPYAKSGLSTNDITMTVNDDGGIAISGVTTEYVAMGIYNGPNIFGNVFTVSLQGTFDGCLANVIVYDSQGNTLCAYTQNETTIDVTQYSDVGSVYIDIKRSGEGIELSGTVYPMVNRGSTVIPWEPYVSGGSITISTPNGLPGIPVEVDGNYTDSNGQQWACDEVDFERGVYIQRIHNITLTGNESIGREERQAADGTSSYRWVITSTESLASADVLTGLCSHFIYAHNPIGTNDLDCAITVYPINGKIYARFDAYNTVDDLRAWLIEQYSVGTQVVISYLLATPIETALSDAELNAYKVAHTNDPNTIILNDSDAHMEVSYNADTKLYSDSVTYLTDTITGKKYKLYVADGNLKMTEVV